MSTIKPSKIQNTAEIRRILAFPVIDLNTTKTSLEELTKEELTRCEKLLKKIPTQKKLQKIANALNKKIKSQEDLKILNDYLKRNNTDSEEIYFKKIEEKLYTEKQMQRENIEYTKALQAYDKDMREYQQEMVLYRKKMKKYTQDMELYKKKQLPHEPLKPIEPERPMEPVNPVIGLATVAAQSRLQQIEARNKLHKDIIKEVKENTELNALLKESGANAPLILECAIQYSIAQLEQMSPTIQKAREQQCIKMGWSPAVGTQQKTLGYASKNQTTILLMPTIQTLSYQAYVKNAYLALPKAKHMELNKFDEFNALVKKQKAVSQKEEAPVVTASKPTTPPETPKERSARLQANPPKKPAPMKPPPLPPEEPPPPETPRAKPTAPTKAPPSRLGQPETRKPNPPVLPEFTQHKIQQQEAAPPTPPSKSPPPKPPGPPKP